MTTLKKGIALVLALCMVLSLGAFSVFADVTVVASGNCGERDSNEDPGSNAEWKLYSDGKVTITGTGSMYDWYDLSGGPWCQDLGTPVTSAEISGVTNVSGDAFARYKSLKSVTIGAGVTSIDSGAFQDCSGLTSVTIGKDVTSIGDTAFQNCSSLTSVTILGSVTSIGNGAFNGCSGLTSVTIPGSVTSIGNNAFNGCKSLTSVNIPEGVTSIGDSVFSGCSGLTLVTIGKDVTSIGSYAFQNCSGLTSVTIPAGVTSIGKYAFCDCSSLTSVNIPEGVKSIGESAFQRCSGLTEIVIPEGVTSIGSSTFSGCTNLTSVTIGAGVTSIGSAAFFGCGLTEIVIPGRVTSIGSSAFWNCTGLTSVTIPNSVTSIGNNVFVGCSGLTSISVENANQSYKVVDGLLLSADGKTLITVPAGLTSVTIPEGVTSIGNDAFRGCSGLTEIVIPDSVTSIGNNAFYNCSGLTSVTIGKGVTKIGNDAFRYCTGLTEITVPLKLFNTKTGKLNTSSPFGGLSPLYYSTSALESVTTVSVNAATGTRTEKTYDRTGNSATLKTTTVTVTDGETGIITKTVTDAETGIITKTVTDAEGNKSEYVVIGGQEIELKGGDEVSKDESGNVVITGSEGSVKTYNASGTQLYTVTYTGTGVTTQTSTVAYGADTPAYDGTPSYAGFIFAGWSPAVAETVTADVTYTAQWIYYNPAPADTEIEDEDVPLADIEDEEVPLADLPLFFEDVADDDWYREAVAYVFSDDLMVGLTDDVFGVYDKTTGRQLAAILYRYADSSKTADETYEGGVEWAAENGLTDGIDFDADANVTREQMVTMIYRLAQAEAVERDLSEFADADEISSYAAEAMAWAVENGIIQGYDTGCVAPKGEITRAEIATIIMRFATLAE